MEYQQQSISKAIKENAGATSSGSVAGTSSSNIAYTPSQVPGDSLKRLAKKKKKWNVIVSPQLPESQLVSFENYLNILVENKHWDDFTFRVFGRGLLESKFIADLEGYLSEAYDEESSDAIETLKQTVISFLNSDQCKLYRHKIAEFTRHFGKNLNFSPVGKSLFTEQNTSGNLANLINFIQKYYKGNLGILDITNHSFAGREPLANIEIFKTFDNLFSQQLSGYLNNIPFSYQAVIDMNFQSSEVLKIDNPQLLQKLGSDGTVKVEGDTIYPIDEKGFPITIVQTILKYIQGE